MEKDIVKGYEELRKKFRLPEFKSLDAEFEVSDIEGGIGEGGGSLLRAVRKKIAEKIDTVCGLFEDTLQPDTSVSNLYESRVFDEESKKAVFDLYRKLMVVKRRADALYILNNDSDDCLFISEALDFWKGIKPQIAGIVKKLGDSWSRDFEGGDKLTYFG